jgi:hypothetical protein
MLTMAYQSHFLGLGTETRSGQVIVGGSYMENDPRVSNEACAKEVDQSLEKDTHSLGLATSRQFRAAVGMAMYLETERLDISHLQPIVHVCYTV